MVKITKAPMAKEPIDLTRNLNVEDFKVEFDELIDPYPDMWKIDFFDRVGMWIQNGAKYSKLIFIIISLITKIGGTMATTNDKKTTRTGIVKGVISAIVSIVMLFFTVDIPAELQTTLVGVVVGVWGLVEIVQGFFTNKPDEDNK